MLPLPSAAHSMMMMMTLRAAVVSLVPANALAAFLPKLIRSLPDKPGARRKPSWQSRLAATVLLTASLARARVWFCELQAPR